MGVVEDAGQVGHRGLRQGSALSGGGGNMSTGGGAGGAEHCATFGYVHDIKRENYFRVRFC
jgi:hypothetical protein